MYKLTLFRFAEGAAASSSATQTIETKVKTTSETSGFKKSISEIRDLRKVIAEISKTPVTIREGSKSTPANIRKKTTAILALTAAYKQLQQQKQKNAAVLSNLKKLGMLANNPQKVVASSSYNQSAYSSLMNNTVNKKLNTGVHQVTGSKDYSSYAFLMKNINLEAAKLPASIEKSNSKLAELLAHMDKLGVSKDRAFKVTAVKKYNDEAYKTIMTNIDVEKSLGKIGDAANKAASKSKNFITKLSDGFNSLQLVKLVYLARSIRRVTSSMVAAVESAADYEESLNLYRLALNEYYDDANKWSDTITTKLMLDPRDVMQYTGAFYNLAKGMQVSKDAAFLMSKNLTQLTYDMSSYLNISVEAAQAKIQSAMAGQSRAVQSVGIATQAASLQELAYSLGIKKKVETMTQAEKTYLRYIQLMRSTTHMQGDLGRTMITPANTIRILKTQIQLLSRAIGQVLTVVLMKAMPYIMAFTNILTDLAAKLADFLGYEFAPIDYSTTFEDNANALGDYADSAEDAGKKVKNSLAPFDELNVVMSSKSTAGDLGGFDTADYDKFLPSYDMLKDYTDKFKKQAEEVEGKLKSILITAGLIWGAFKIGKLISRFVDLTTVLGKIPGIGSVISTVFGKSATAAGKTAEAAGDAAKSAGLLSKIPWGKILGFGAGVTLSGLNIYRKEKNVDKLQEGTLNGDEFGENYITNTLGTVAGGAIAGATFGPLGAIIGAGVGGVASVIQDIKLLNETIKDGDFSVKYMTENAKKGYTEMQPAIIETYESIVDLNNSMTITPAQKNKVIASMEGLMSEINENVVENKTRQSKLISDSLANGVFNQAEADDILVEMSNHYDSLTTKAEDAQKKITEILAKYGGDQKKITEDDRKVLMEQYAILERASVESISSMSGEQLAILEDLKNKKKDISIQSASDMIKKSAEVRDQTIADANKQYETILEEANKMYKAGIINEDQYNKIKDNATKTRDEAIRAAEEQHQDVYDEFKKSNEDIARYIDEDTGQVLSKWDIFWGNAKTKFKTSFITPTKELLGELWTEFKRELTNLKNGFLELLGLRDEASKGYSGGSGRRDGAGGGGGGSSGGGRRYATGGYPTSGELFFANENGAAEFITRTGNRTAVYNQDQMVSALTNAIVSGFHSLGNGSSGPQNLTVQIGNDKIYKGQVSYQNRQVDRYGTSKTIKV